MLPGPMMQEMMNIESLHIPCDFDAQTERRIMQQYNIPGDKLCLDLEFYRQSRTELEISKQERMLYLDRQEYLDEILRDLTTG